MTITSYTTNELLDAISSLIKAPGFFTRTFFSTVRTSDKKTVHVDVEKKKRRLAPFVHPKSQGQVVESESFQTNEIVPAYIKDKRVYDPEDAVDYRTFGEQLAGELTPQEREEAWIVKTLMDMMEMKDRRLEVMASEALRTGQVTIDGEGFDEIVVDFGRASGHTVTLAGGSRWGQSAVRPYANLKTWALTVQQASGSFPRIVTFDPDAWDLFQQDDEVKDLLDTRRGSNAMVERAAGGRAEPEFVGRIGSFEFWTYQDWYVDPATETETVLLPQFTVVMGSPEGVEGRQYYGAIKDRKAGYRPLPFFPKSWDEEDPSGLVVMGQSAPLVGPLRPDASFCATVNS